MKLLGLMQRSIIILGKILPVTTQLGLMLHNNTKCDTTRYNTLRPKGTMYNSTGYNTTRHYYNV